MEENKMKKMSKVLACLMAVLTLVSLCACGQSGSAASSAELYNCQSDSVEAGYEGDCIMTTAYVLALNSDGSYTLMKNFFVNQVSGIVVAYTTDYFTGTYKVDSEADGVKTVTLSAATDCLENVNGSPLTSTDDSSLLEGFTGGTVTCDTATNTLTMPA
jgi:hypothetical protein